MAVPGRWSLACCVLAVAAVTVVLPFNREDARIRFYHKDIEYPDITDDWRNGRTVYDFIVRDEHNKPFSFSKYRGFMLIIVNLNNDSVMSKRLFQELNNIYNSFREYGLRIAGFLADSPITVYKDNSTDEQMMKKFRTDYFIEYDLFKRIKTYGEKADPLFKFLVEKEKERRWLPVTWTFTKIIVNENGKPVEYVDRYVTEENIRKLLVKHMNNPRDRFDLNERQSLPVVRVLINILKTKSTFGNSTIKK